MKTTRSTAAILLALTAVAGIAACSHDKTRESESAMRDPVTAADTPTAVNGDSDTTYIHTAKTAEESPKVEIAQMENTNTSANNTLPSSSSADEVQNENAQFETSNRK